jgi:hypothetical protein
MTDDVGLLQHACFTVPSYREGYTTDDNARGLVVTVLLEESGEGTANERHVFASRYLAFLWYAFDSRTGRFRNYLPYERRWQEKAGSEDCHGRALWGLGMVIGRSRNAGLNSAAGRLFDASLPTVSTFTSPRAWSFALLGIHEYLNRFFGDRAARNLHHNLAGRLLKLYRDNAAPDWKWFEDRLTYCNAVLPHALLASGHALACEEMVAAAIEALEWLTALQKAHRGHFVPIGSNGFYIRGGDRARFDQQPIEAQATVSACLAAHAITKVATWSANAHKAFDWFLGRNDLGQSLFDPETGGCRDGLHADRCNENQGAESTLAFLQALLELRLAESG